MKRVLYSVCIGILALALTAGAAQAAKDKRSERAKPQQRTAKVQAARPANIGATMSPHRNVSAAQYRQRSYAKPRTSSNAVVKHNTGLRAVRERNLARNEALRERNRTQEFRARNNVAVNRDRNLVVTRTRNDVNRYRNTNESRARNSVAVNRERDVTVNRTRVAEVNRARNNMAINRNRNFAVNRTGNAAYYRGGK